MADSILDSDCEALVNPVNCVGVMGKGLAREFRIKYPYMFLDYKDACKEGKMKPGSLHYYYDRSSGKVIYNFATKEHWKGSSKIEWIERGLQSLRGCVKWDFIKSIAVPALGCGNGGLDWGTVEPMIWEALGDLGIRVDVYPPDGPKYTL